MFGALSPPPPCLLYLLLILAREKAMPIRLIQGTPGWRKNLATSPAPTDSRLTFGAWTARTPRMCGCFLKWWYPTTMGFPTKNDRFGCFRPSIVVFSPPKKKHMFSLGFSHSFHHPYWKNRYFLGNTHIISS